MNAEAVERALAIVRREMGCIDARLEFGGRATEAADCIVATTPSGFRLVAQFENPPDDRASFSLRLRQLALTFFDGAVSMPVPREDAEQQLAQRRLDDELCALSGRVGATGATVIDIQSPVIWGCSEGRNPEEDLDTLLTVAALDNLARTRSVDLAVVSGLREDDRASALSEFQGEDRSRLELLISRMASRPLRARQAHLIHSRALQQVRASWKSYRPDEGTFRRLHHGQDLGYFARVFAGIYILVAYFPGPFSELRVEGSALHALPLIERHVLGLPPVDPNPPRGLLVKLPLPT